MGSGAHFQDATQPAARVRLFVGAGGGEGLGFWLPLFPPDFFCGFFFLFRCYFFIYSSSTQIQSVARHDALPSPTPDEVVRPPHKVPFFGGKSGPTRLRT